MSGNVTAQGERNIILPDGTVWVIPPHPLSGRIQPADQLIPRVCQIPDYAFSSGPECIELAASAGLILDPWEQLTLILGLGETAAGKWAAFTVALIVARQNGKGADLEALALYWLFGTGERLIGHTAHEYKTAMEAFRRVLFLIENTDWMRKKVKKIINTNGEEGIELLNGQRLRFLARSKGAGRGFSFPKLIWDEAYALTETQQEAQLPTLSAMRNAQIWVTSSPPLTSDTGGPMFALQRNAGKGAEDIAFMDYGAAGNLDDLDQVDLDDRAEWERRNPNCPERITIETIARERASLSDRGFARERLCIWPPNLEDGYLVISEDQWTAMTDPDSGEGITQLVIGMSVGPRSAGPPNAALGIAGRRPDGGAHIELIRSGTGTGWMIPRIISVAKSLGAWIVIDPGSPSGSLLADLELAMKEADLPAESLVKMTSRDVAAAFGMIYDAATSATPGHRPVTHLGQAELAIAVGGAVKRKVGDGHAWDGANATVDITGLRAVTDGLWGLAKRGDSDRAEPMVMWA